MYLIKFWKSNLQIFSIFWGTYTHKTSIFLQIKSIPKHNFKFHKSQLQKLKFLRFNFKNLQPNRNLNTSGIATNYQKFLATFEFPSFLPLRCYFLLRHIPVSQQIFHFFTRPKTWKSDQYQFKRRKQRETQKKSTNLRKRLLFRCEKWRRRMRSQYLLLHWTTTPRNFTLSFSQSPWIWTVVLLVAIGFSSCSSMIYWFEFMEIWRLSRKAPQLKVEGSN